MVHPWRNARCSAQTFTATGVAVNRGADFVKHLVPSRRARQNKALDPTALAGCPQASLLPSDVLAGQRRDYNHFIKNLIDLSIYHIDLFKNLKF